MSDGKLTISLVVFGHLFEEFAIEDGFVVALLERADPAEEWAGEAGERVQSQSIYDEANTADNVQREKDCSECCDGREREEVVLERK